MIPLKDTRMNVMNIIMEEAAVIESITLKGDDTFFRLECYANIGWQTSEGPLITICMNHSIFIESFRCQYGYKRPWTYVDDASSVIKSVNQITKHQP